MIEYIADSIRVMDSIATWAGEMGQAFDFWKQEDPMEEKNGTNAVASSPGEWRATPVASLPRDPMVGAKLLEVIEVLANRGTGHVETHGEEDRVRQVRRYYSKGGDLLAEDDHHGQRCARDRLALAKRRIDELAADNARLLARINGSPSTGQGLVAANEAARSLMLAETKRADRLRREANEAARSLMLAETKRADRLRREVAKLRARLKPYLTDEALSKRGAITPPHLRERSKRRPK